MTTYNRPSMCLATVKALLTEVPRVNVYLDGFAKYPWKRPGAVFHRLAKAPGRETYFQVWNRIMSDARDAEWEYFLSLPDDFVPAKPGPVKHLVSLMKMHPTADAIVPVVDNRGRGPCWIPHIPEPHGPLLWHTQWLDGCFIARRSLFDAVGWAVPEMLPNHFRTNQSSGVGKYMSVAATNGGATIFQVSKTLYHHGGHDSVMHEKHRREVPL